MNLIEQFNNLKTDREKWEFVIKHKTKLTVNLDNDDTFVTLHDDEEGEVGQFDYFVGWDDGLYPLFAAIGITAECV